MFSVVPELRVVGPQTVEESQCYTQLCVSTNILATVPISVMYSITDGSAISEVGKLYIALQWVGLYANVSLVCFN